MSTPFLAQVYIFPYNFAPKGWAMCNGQSMIISQNQALFSLLGTTYGGDGQTTFALPNMKSRVPVSKSGNHPLGQSDGEESHTLLVNEAGHNHPVNVAGINGNVKTPVGNLYAMVQGTATNVYSTAAPDVSMPLASNSQGLNGSHNNVAPFLTLNLCIALQGIFPSRN